MPVAALLARLRSGWVLAAVLLAAGGCGGHAGGSTGHRDCQGYDPCITPGPDVDCAGGTGDGPRYVDGPITVTGSDPYGLDRNHDGVGCE